ncbi:MAG: hypothetical protein P4L40_22535, partial [Terracidiphilus sp.]|nr:hypothetical protein [Terracidiphilus sp.]
MRLWHTYFRLFKFSNSYCCCVCSGAVTSLTYNDLYLPTPRTVSVSSGVKSRAACSASTLVQPFDYCIPSGTDYALAITGINDPLKETFPTSLDVGSWSEPDWGSEDSYHTPYPPAVFTPTATVSGLTVGNSYSLLRFDGASSLPAAGGFLASNTWAVR